MRIRQFMKQDTVLFVAMILAVLSSFAVHPDRKYVDYIDFRTLGILLSLMTVMAGAKRQGVFDRMGQALLLRTKGILQLFFVLVGICFFGSMFITNDVALMTFVPFTFAVLDKLDAQIAHRLVLPIVCMQTIAANLGSMLTPIGNPQNLYLYGKEDMNIFQFVKIMLPYSVVSLVLLAVWAIATSAKQTEELSSFSVVQNCQLQNKKVVGMYAILFIACLLAVIHVLPYGIVLAGVLVCTFCADKMTLKEVDYSLLVTFIAFFVFIGNMGRVPAFSNWLIHILAGHETIVAVFASQITSNVPAALLLSGFTQDVKALIVGTNLGGLGTLIASMASLISYRQIARKLPQEKGRYFGLFTISNVVFLVLLLMEWLVLRFF